jgi:hypothetical protein
MFRSSNKLTIYGLANYPIATSTKPEAIRVRGNSAIPNIVAESDGQSSGTAAIPVKIRRLQQVRGFAASFVAFSLLDASAATPEQAHPLTASAAPDSLLFKTLQ